MFGRIQNLDNRVLESIGKIHKPILNKIMIAVPNRATSDLSGGESALYSWLDLSGD